MRTFTTPKSLFTTREELWTSQPRTETEENTACWPDWLLNQALTGSTTSQGLTFMPLANQVRTNFPHCFPGCVYICFVKGTLYSVYQSYYLPKPMPIYLFKPKKKSNVEENEWVCKAGAKPENPILKNWNLEPVDLRLLLSSGCLTYLIHVVKRVKAST